MPKMLLICLFISLLALPVLGQSVDTAWVRRYNGIGGVWDRASGIAVDASGNVYVTGSSYGIYATVKYYPDGRNAWAAIYAGPGYNFDYPTAIAIDSSGNVYVTGYSDGGSVTHYDYTTIKYYPNGIRAWVKRYDGPASGDDYAYSMAVDACGNAYVTGTSPGDSTGLDYLTVKYLPNGDTAWTRRYNGLANNYNDLAHAATVDDSGNAYITGESGYFWDETSPYGPYYVRFYNQGYATIEYSPNGDTRWVNRKDADYSRSPSVAYAMTVDKSHSIYVTGNAGTVKYGADGSKLWYKQWGGVATAVDGSGNCYVTGVSGGDYSTVKYNPGGDTAWIRRYNGPGNSSDKPTAIALDKSGNVYVTGRSYGIGTHYDYATVKYCPNGDTAWTVRYNGPADSDDCAAALAVDDSGNVYVTGYSYGPTSYDDYLSIKYVQFLRGDVNHDKKVTIADVVFLVSYLFKSGSAPNPIQSGDANCDGKVTIADIVYLVAYLFKHGPTLCI